MTHRATYQQQSSETKQASAPCLVDAIKTHAAAEVASFHTPGHKGLPPFADAAGAWRFDVTELPGLDDLSAPRGVLLQLQNHAADIWDTAATYVSVNGASGALTAAILACANRGTHILLPRNAHRSAINALVLSGLKPIWFTPSYDPDWQLYGAVETDEFSKVLAANANTLACVLAVSPTYAGEMSDIAEISMLCHAHAIPLIVDEAHGAHLMTSQSFQPGALPQGADLVVHSAHKTLTALTQTGLLHVSKRSLVPPEAVHASLNLLQTSSPSYLLLAALEETLCMLEKAESLPKIHQSQNRFLKQMANICGVEILSRGRSHPGVDPMHILVRIENVSPDHLFAECCQWGVFPEAILGRGVLFLLGAGSRSYEVEALADALEHIALEAKITCADGTIGATAGSAMDQVDDFCSEHEQVLSPRDAFFAASETVAIADSLGRIAAECVAPCPPGIPVIVPGMRVAASAIAFCPQTHLRVVVESGPRRT